LIDKIVREAACPVIVLLHAPDPASAIQREMMYRLGHWVRGRRPR
jgi:hypothetical protein